MAIDLKRRGFAGTVLGVEADSVNAAAAEKIGLADSVVPVDEAIEIMYNVGRSLPASLRETSLGGTATSISACRSCHRKSS